MKHPNFLKAILFTEDLCEVGGSVLQSGCYTVQDYSYCCKRNRDELGNSYGPIRSGYLEFTIRVDVERGCKRFYQRMAEQDNAPFSFIFNASFLPNGRLKGYDDGMVTYGYIVDIEEFCSDVGEGLTSQMLLRIKVLLSNIVYVGHDTPRNLYITHD
jgi:hypothetical protein